MVSRVFFSAVVFVLLFSFSGIAQLKLCAWNIQNFGKSKSDSEIVYMAGLLREFDVVGIVEVVAGRGGSQAVARLADELNRTGNKWDYLVSDATSGSGSQSERYACLWKTARVKRVGEAALEKSYAEEMQREPFYVGFLYNNRSFTLALFHAIPKNRQPETEIKYLKLIQARDSSKNLIFAGDFNCPQSHTVFNPLKSRGYKPGLINCKTTIKMKPKGTQCLASEYDNIFYDAARIKLLKSGVVAFYKDFPTLTTARRISDHLPVWMELEFR